MCVYVNVHTSPCTHAYACKQAHTQTRVYTTYNLTHWRIRENTRTLNHQHTHTHTHIQTHANTHMQVSNKKTKCETKRFFGPAYYIFNNHVHTATLYTAEHLKTIAQQLCILLCNTACPHTRIPHTSAHTHTHTHTHRMHARPFTHTHAHPHPYPNTYHARAKKRVCVLTWWAEHLPAWVHFCNCVCVCMYVYVIRVFVEHVCWIRTCGWFYACVCGCMSQIRTPYSMQRHTHMHSIYGWVWLLEHEHACARVCMCLSFTYTRAPTHFFFLAVSCVPPCFLQSLFFPRPFIRS